jgi:hypothetical protein
MPRITRPDMSAYGVPEELDGTLPWSWAEARLAETRNYWLVTVNGSGRPHSMPVWGVWMPERERFGFSCAPTARKVRNIDANPQVVVTNDDTVHALSIEGTAERLDDAATIVMARAWAAKYGDEPGIGDAEEMIGFLRQNASFEVVPDRAFGMIETAEDFGPAATKWTWDQGR